MPLAVSCIEETNVVVSTAPLSRTCAPPEKLWPVIDSVKPPAVTDVGAMLLKTGVGFQSVTLLSPVALESAALIASIVTLFGFGKLAGAVYTPEELIVPAAALPPATPFTSQVTPVFDVPVTLALKVCVAPMRTFTGLGDTETLTAGGGFPELPELPEEPLVTPAHRAWKRDATITRISEARRMAIGTIGLGKCPATGHAELLS